MKVFAFDIGLRNLAAVVVRQKPDFRFSDFPEFKTYAHAEETADEFKLRALRHFLHAGWELEQWDLIDVSEVLDRDVKNVKRLSDVSKSIALADSLQVLEDKWFSDSAPDVVCVETQHNANAIMRGVGMGTLVFFRRSFPETVLESKSGSHKLKICDALGVREGDGLVPGQEKKAAASEKQALKEQKKAERLRKKTGGDKSWLAPCLVVEAPPPPPPQEAPSSAPPFVAEKKKTAFRGAAAAPGRFFKSSGKKKEKYEDNKIRAVLAVAVLMPEGHDILRLHSKKQDDLCDVLLMALWVLWSRISPRAPVKKRLKAPSVSK